MSGAEEYTIHMPRTHKGAFAAAITVGPGTERRTIRLDNVLVSDCDKVWMTALQLKGDRVRGFRECEERIQGMLEGWCAEHERILSGCSRMRVRSPLRDMGNIFFFSFRLAPTVDASHAIGYICNMDIELRDLRGELNAEDAYPVWRVCNIERKLHASQMDSLLRGPDFEYDVDPDRAAREDGAAAKDGGGGAAEGESDEDEDEGEGEGGAEGGAAEEESDGDEGEGEGEGEGDAEGGAAEEENDGDEDEGDAGMSSQGAIEEAAKNDGETNDDEMDEEQKELLEAFAALLKSRKKSRK